MASQEQIEKTYDYMDKVLRRALGECFDLSGAFYDGDYSLSLEQAQRAKHDYVLSSINFKAGARVLDIGCGWGPMLAAIRAQGGRGIGITLSAVQAKACGRNGLDAHVKDWKSMSVNDYGHFDAIVSIGAFEHFCSVEEYRLGNQDEVYGRFFNLCRELLPPRGRLYLQTMVWDKASPYEVISLKAPKGQDAHLLALLQKFYPGSWLPYGEEQICRNAGGFSLISANSGRRDYIQTMEAWNQRKIWRQALHPRLLTDLAMRYATSRDFRYQLSSLRRSLNRRCFERGIWDHKRMLFEKL